jgi:hypothetical protein
MMNRKLFSDLTDSLGKIGSGSKVLATLKQVPKQLRSSWRSHPMNEVINDMAKGGYS